MAPKMTPAQQEKHFTQGLALGLLSHGVVRVPRDKLMFEFALSRALRNCPSIREVFPAIGSSRRADPYYLLSGGRAEKRRGPLMAAWREHQDGWEPYVYQEGWQVAEAGEMLAGWCGTRWEDWHELGRAFVSYFDEREAHNR